MLDRLTSPDPARLGDRTGIRSADSPTAMPGPETATEQAARTISKAQQVTAPRAAEPGRLMSLDAYRGFIMLVMASGGFAFSQVAKEFDGSDLAGRVWRFLGYQFDHVAWTGCSFWDLIQPSFMFMVGVALPYSYAKRQARSDSPAKLLWHVIYRSIVLILLGIFLSSNSSKQTNFTFVNVLTQIGLGYTVIFLLWGKGPKVQLGAVVAILVGYSCLFYLYPAPGPDFDYAAVRVPDDFERFTGLAAHWNKNANFAAAFDLWFLNLFPRPEPFRFNDGGYQTLNFVPSLATMIFGLMAGEWLRSSNVPTVKAKRLVAAGAACLAIGLAIDHTIWPESLAALVPGFDRSWSLCPIVKRIWTPSWAVFSTGWTLWMLAAFYWVIDLKGYRRWSFPLVVVGMNSIAMYCMSQLLKPWTRNTLMIHFSQTADSVLSWFGWSFPGVYVPVLQSVTVLLVLWLFCCWMYRQRIFVRI